VIEFYDTGSRYLFVLELYFSETSLNALDLFTRFLLYGPFPQKRIRLRPDRAKGFLNLKRPIHELNIKYSLPDGFYMEPDFTGPRSPKHKVHLESSHRSLHHFEIRIIKKFADKILKQKYTVVVGAEKFSSHKSTPVFVSFCNNKLYIFEPQKDGVLLGEALCQKRSEKPKSVVEKSEKRLKQNEVEQIASYLEARQMSVDMKSLIACYRNGLTFTIAKAVFENNTKRYDRLVAKLHEPDRAGFVRFNAFAIDYYRYQRNQLPATGKASGP
jgi:hypothetical protein